MSGTIEILDEMRHACLSCGGSCQGNWVRPIGDEEDRIRALAPSLGITDPVVDGKLRMVDGKCVFLDADNLCSIHRKYGPAAKPTICRQYPLVATRVGEVLRVGLDPGCYTHVRTWREGPVLEDVALVASQRDLPAEQARYEENLVDLCGLPGMNLAQFVQPLTGEQAPADGGLPPRFARRIVRRLKEVDLDGLIDRPDTAPKLRWSLGHVASAARAWDPAAPPAWPALAPTEEAYAIDVIRRMVYLRLAWQLPSVAGVALLTAMGAIAAAWSTNHPHAYGATLAGWVRAVRAPAFWQALAPDTATMTWLARGDAAKGE